MNQTTSPFLGALERMFHDGQQLVFWNDIDGEFSTEIDGIRINGVDLIRWNDAGQITDFKVMVRPLKAINLLHQKMGAMLQRLQQQSPGQQQQQP